MLVENQTILTYPSRTWRRCREEIPVEFNQGLRQQKTRDPELFFGVVCVILCFAVLIQYRPVTDGQTDRGKRDHSI